MSRVLDPEDIYRLPLPSDPQLSADGRFVIFAQRVADRVSDDYRTSIWRVSADGPIRDPERLTDAEHDAHPSLSPDGQNLVVLRRVGSQDQLWLIPLGPDATAGEPVPLTDPADLPHGAGPATWSPDGKSLAFVAPVRRGRVGVQVVSSEDPRTSDPTDLVEDQAPIVADRLAFKSDGAGRYRELVHHVFRFDIAERRLTRLTDGDWHAGPPCWSPNGQKIAFTAALESDADIEMTSSAYLVDADPADHPTDEQSEEQIGLPGNRLHQIGRSRYVSGPLVWLPDSTAVVAIGRPDWTIGNKHLYLLRLDEADVDLTAGLDLNVLPGSAAYPGAPPTVSGDGRLLFCVRARGWTHLYALDPQAAAPSPTPVFAEPHRSITGLGARPGLDRLAVVLAGQQQFGEVAVIDGDGVDVRTALVETALPDVELITATLRQFAISDQTSVAGWLFRPSRVGGPTPLLLDVHGGPHNAWTGLADLTHVYQQQLLDRGWSVLIINPRGSDGYGEAFLRGVVGGWGVADERDFTEPIDQLIDEGSVDPDRVAITGYSYGGFTTCRLTAVTDRFVAAVAGGVVNDLTAGVGASDLGLELTRAFKDADPITEQQRLADLSPIRRIGEVSTPTLVLHGEDDHRCPVNQAERWFGLLRVQRVPTRLVVYPGGSHSFVIDGRPSHRIDYNERTVDWLTRWSGSDE